MNIKYNINNQIEYINNNEMTFYILFNQEFQNYNINYLYLYINKFQKIYNKIFQNIFKKLDIYNQYNCLLSFEDLISKYSLVIKILINNKKFKNNGYNIFLLCLKENYKSIEYFYEKIIINFSMYENNVLNLKIYHKILLSFLKIIGILLKFSIYFNKLSLTKKLLLLYLNILKNIYNNYKLKDSEEINNYKYNFCFCLFNVSIFSVINYLPLKISIELSNLVKFIYSKNYDEELNINEKILLFKNIYNLGFYNYIYGNNKEAINNLIESKNKLLQLTNLFSQEYLFQNKINTIDAISKNSLFVIKNDEENFKTSSKTIKKSDYLNNIYSNEQTFIKKIKNNILYQFEKKIYLKEKILKNIELTIGEIELDNNNYVSAYKHIQEALNYLKKNLEKPNNSTLLNKKYKIKSSIIKQNENNFSIEKRKIEKLLSEIEKQCENNVQNKNSNELNENKKNKKNYESSKLIIKELEKFFIFLCSLNLYQIQILNDSQPEINIIKQRNDLPIFFSNNFKDCLTQNQRNLLNNISNLALSRCNILKNPMEKIELKNFNFNYFIIKEKKYDDYIDKKQINNIEDINNNNNIENKNFKKIIESENINQETKNYLIENSKYVLKILKKSSDEEVMNLIDNPKILINPINKYIKKNKENIQNKNYEEEDKNDDKINNSKKSLEEYYNNDSHESKNIINNLDSNSILEENKEYLLNNIDIVIRTGDNLI